MTDESLSLLVTKARKALEQYLKYRELIVIDCSEDLKIAKLFADCYERLAVPYLEELEDILEEIQEVVCGLQH